MPRRKVYTLLNNSETFSCESNGQPLNSCLWARTLNGQRQVIIVDDQDGGRKSVEGISYIGDGLREGKCSIEIESVTAADVGTWSCTLVSESGAIFNGEVSVSTKSKYIRTTCTSPFDFNSVPVPT